MTRRPLPLTLAALGTVALLLSGCSRDSATPPPAGTTAPPTGNQVTTVWAERPEPCTLLTDAAVAEIVGFDVSAGPLAAADGGGPDTCAWRNANFGLEGGAVTIRVLPPGSDLAADRRAFTAVADVPGLGVQAYTGAAPGAFGPGITAAVVDMGAGGFGLVVSTYEVRTQEETLQLARLAAQRWTGGGGSAGAGSTTSAPVSPSAPR